MDDSDKSFSAFIEACKNTEKINARTKPLSKLDALIIKRFTIHSILLEKDLSIDK
jgi:hypothetical protein